MGFKQLYATRKLFKMILNDLKKHYPFLRRPIVQFFKKHMIILYMLIKWLENEMGG